MGEGIIITTCRERMERGWRGIYRRRRRDGLLLGGIGRAFGVDVQVW